LLFELHEHGLIVINLKSKTNSTASLMKTGLGGTWSAYNSSSPCEFIVTTNDPYPRLEITTGAADLSMNATVDIRCKLQPNDTEFVHAVSLIFNYRS